MKQILIVVFCLLLLFSAPALAQKGRKPPGKKPVYKLKTREEPVIPGDRFFFVMTLDGAGNASTVLQNENGALLSPAQTAMFFKKLSRMGDTRLAADARRALAPGVIIKPDRSLKYGKLVEAVRAARDPSDLRVLVAVEDGFYLGIPRKPDPKNRPRPDPLLTIVNLDDENNLDLNGEPLGSLSDTSELENYLKRIFQARAENGVFREGTNVVETAVFLVLPDSAPVADVVRLAKAVRAAGSDTVGLDINGLEIIIEMTESPRKAGK